MKTQTETATFAAGCFWGVEARFRETPGVLETEVGYTGGSIDEPDYKTVCSGATGHAEAVRVVYDPDRISYAELLELFFSIHNPTTRNRQGPDIGSQYRSAIFYTGPEQRQQAEERIRELDASGRWPAPVVTTIEAQTAFWRAEEYHQQYIEKNGGGHCAI
jgi:peptide-methionine (S)-S-oxide reductase